MLVCVDVQYGDDHVTTAVVGFSSWTDETPQLERVLESHQTPEPYAPGQFYKREMPFVLEALKPITEAHDITAIIIDAHVWLDDDKPGFGAHLYRALDKRIPVIGVAKGAFRASGALPVQRGKSTHPLYITAAGLDPTKVAKNVRIMHGPFRQPTLLKRADSLARGNALPDPDKTGP